MFSTLLTLHSITRWIVLVFLLFSIYRALVGYTTNKAFSKTDNAFRHWTTTFAHIQLMIGMTLYTESAMVKYFWSNTKLAIKILDITFYSLIHIILMTTSVVLLTIGSAIAKKQTNDKDKFKTMLFWFSIVVIIIFIAIPWPFSPLSSRPIFRGF